MRQIDLRKIKYKSYSNTTDVNEIGQIESFESIDLYDSEKINVTFQNRDIKDYGKSKLSFSKTFSLPGTENNLRLLNIKNALYSTDVVDYNNLLNPIPVSLFINDINIFNGSLVITEINLVGDLYNINCNFITNFFNILPLIKDVNFNDPLFVTPYTPYLASNRVADKPVLPENWLWDSILFENYKMETGTFSYNGATVSSKPSKYQLFPVTGSTGSHYPIYNVKGLTAFADHIQNSWVQSCKTSTVHWTFVDDGKIKFNQSVFNQPDRINIQTGDFNPRRTTSLAQNQGNGYGMLTARGLSYTEEQFDVNMFNMFETIKPAYYVGDIFRKILRYVEYKINANLYELVNLNDDSTINYTNYDNPNFDYPTLIKLDFESDVVSAYDESPLLLEGLVEFKPLDAMLFVCPENEKYPNVETNISIIARTTDVFATQPFSSVKYNLWKHPITFYPEVGTQSSKTNWDKYDICFFDASYVFSNRRVTNQTINFEERLSFAGIDIYGNTFSQTINAGTSITRSIKRWFSSRNINVLPVDERNELLSQLPSGYTLSNFVYLDQILNESDEDKLFKFWKWIHVNWQDYTPSTSFTNNFADATCKNFNKSYDLRRYLYPETEGITMSDFVIDIMKTFNVVLDEPSFNSSDSKIKFETYNKKYIGGTTPTGFFPGVPNAIDITDKIDLTKSKIKYEKINNIDLKIKQQEARIIDDFFKNNKESGLNLGEIRVNFQKFNRTDKSLVLETKVSRALCRPLVVIPQLGFPDSNPYFSFSNSLSFLYAFGLDDEEWRGIDTGAIMQIPAVFDYDDIPKLDNYNLTDIIVKNKKYKPFFIFNSNLSYIYSRYNKIISFLSDRIIQALPNPSINYNIRIFNRNFVKKLVDVTGDTNVDYGLPFHNLSNQLSYVYSLEANNKNWNLLYSGDNWTYPEINGYEYYRLDILNLQNRQVIETEIDLKLVDIINLDLSQKYSIRLDDVVKIYRINKINSFDMETTGKTKVEFVEITF